MNKTNLIDQIAPSSLSRATFLRAPSKPIADLDHMKIGSMSIAPIHTGIGYVMEPIAHANPPIDFRSDRYVPHKLERASRALVCEAVLAEERAATSNFQRKLAVFLSEHNPWDHGADK